MSATGIGSATDTYLSEEILELNDWEPDLHCEATCHPTDLRHADGGPLWHWTPDCSCQPRLLCDKVKQYWFNQMSTKKLVSGVCGTCLSDFEVKKELWVVVRS